MHHITILHHIFFALGTHFAGFFGFGFAAQCPEIIIGNHFRTDKASFEIGVDFAGRLRRGVAFVYGPGAHFFHPGGVLGLPAVPIIAGADEAV